MRLYVGNLPFKATEGDIQSFFEESGFAVEAINLMKDKFTGQPRGFGFVDVPDEQGEAAVRSCNGKELLGRALVINEARPMTPGGGGGGGGRPRSGGGGGGGGFGRDRDRRGRF
jgi:RNA recognition motif-containing protein